jgi:CelD/BcsL family acetyltransferase involved in cellulose biosynthesis
VGTLLQAFQIEQLAADGVRIYDLGMEMAYKRRWADETLDTRTTVIIRR